MEMFKSNDSLRITQNGGPAGRVGWRTVLLNEKHEFSAGWRVAQKGGLACCTTGRASGLHIKLGFAKRQARGLPFSAVRPALFRSPLARPFVQYAGPPFCAARQKFTFLVWKHGRPARPARRSSN